MTLFKFIDGGAFQEITLERNCLNFDKIQLRKRVIKPVGKINTEAFIFGQKMAQPLILGPVGFAGAYARRKEAQAAQAAERAGIPFILSSVAICSIEEMPSLVWLQLYFFKDKGHSLNLHKHTEAAKCPVLVFSVDFPVVGGRYRYLRAANSMAFSAQNRHGASWRGFPL